MRSLSVASASSRQWGGILFVAVGLILLVALAANLCLGEYHMPPDDVWHTLLGSSSSPIHRYILISVREPRIFIALLTGAAFGISGALLQSFLRNPLADPGILGINDGASLFVTILLVFSPEVPPYVLPLVAFAGAAFALTALLALTAGQEFQPLRIFLNGIGLSLFLYAGTKIVKTVGKWQLVQSAIEWLQGNLTGVSWPHVKLLLPWFACGLILTVFVSPLLEVHALGEETAIGLGSRLGRERFLLLFLVALLTGSAVSITGPVYFVGFLSGNLARLVSTLSQRTTVFLSGLIGATLVLIADLLARLLVAPRELRLVFLVDLVGAPILTLLLIGRYRSAVRTR